MEDGESYPTTARVGGYLPLVEPVRAVAWAPGGGAVRILDQRRLPAEVVWRDLRSLDDLALVVRSGRVVAAA